MASNEKAVLALDVASAIIEKLFPAVLRKMELHIHEGFRICNNWKCQYEGTSIGKILKDI